MSVPLLEQGGEPIPFLVGSVAPFDVVGLRELGDLAYPGHCVRGRHVCTSSVGWRVGTSSATIAPCPGTCRSAAPRRRGSREPRVYRRPLAATAIMCRNHAYSPQRPRSDRVRGADQAEPVPGPAARTRSTCCMASRRSSSQASACWPTSLTRSLRRGARRPHRPGVENPSLRLTESCHHRDRQRREQLAHVTAVHAPGDLSSEAALGLARDRDPGAARLLAKPLTRPAQAAARSASDASSATDGAGILPMMVISRSSSTSGAPSNQSCGSRPANQPRSFSTVSLDVNMQR